MTKRFQTSVVLCVVFLAAGMYGTGFSASPEKKSIYYQQVPHVVLPQTIQYHPIARNLDGEIKSGGYRNNHPATYTAYPSYQSEEPLEFRTIKQVSYPVTPTTPTWSTPEQTAEYWNNNQVEIQKPAWIEKQESKQQPKSEIREEKQQLQSNIPKRDLSPALPEQQTVESEKKWTRPSTSLVFVQPQTVEEDIAPAPLHFQRTLVADAEVKENPLWQTNWWMNADDFTIARQVAFDQPAPPTSFQAAQIAPSYAGCFGTMPYYAQQPYSGYNCAAAATPNQYVTSRGITDAWNAYYSAYTARQNGGIQQVSAPYPGMMNGMNMNMMGVNGGMNPMGQQQSPQTLGYIVLYPAPQQQAKNADGTDAAPDPNAPATAQNGMQAMFVPFDSPQGMSIQQNMQQNMMQSAPQNMMGMGAGMPSMMNPMMMNPMMMNPMMMNPMMMNPMMMNPMMMNPMMMGMNPYMMNPMMSGMMGQPQIIIQMPQTEQRQGLFARFRQKRAGSGNAQATATIAPANTAPANTAPANTYTACGDAMSSNYRIPAKAAYPYGYFGASSEPFQAGNFTGYNNSQYSNVTYPGY